jgi:hypothetical protein
MLDIETLGVEPGCVVLSIGAVAFTSTTLGNTFHAHISVEDSVNHGLVIEPRTVMWWMEQSDEARKAITVEGVPLLQALDDFRQAFDWKDTKVWCNGASFDFPIVKALFSAVGQKLPWAYYNEMDFRTVKNFFSKKQYDGLKVIPNIKHDGLEDAKAQAATLQNMLGAGYEFDLAA